MTLATENKQKAESESVLSFPFSVFATPAPGACTDAIVADKHLLPYKHEHIYTDVHRMQYNPTCKLALEFWAICLTLCGVCALRI